MQRPALLRRKEPKTVNSLHFETLSRKSPSETSMKRRKTQMLQPLHLGRKTFRSRFAGNFNLENRYGRYISHRFLPYFIFCNANRKERFPLLFLPYPGQFDIKTLLSSGSSAASKVMLGNGKLNKIN